MPDGLLLLHAFPLDHEMWRPQIEEFQPSLPVVTPDFPGFGTSSSSFPPTMDGAADAAAQALDAAGVERAVVCGLSMGGYVALAFWRRHRDRVAGLVFANTRGDADDEAGRKRRADLAARLRQEGSGFMLDNPPPLLSANAPGDLWTFVKNRIGSQSAEAIAGASLAMAERPDSMADLANVHALTLVITSSDDTLIPSDITKRMTEALPNARYEVIEGAGHLSNLEQPDAFNELLHDHLVRCGLLNEPRPHKYRVRPTV